MFIDGIEFSSGISGLLKEVKELSGRDIVIHIKDAEKYLSPGAMGCQQFLPDKSILIAVGEKDILEEILSHELLHVYLIFKFFPQYNTVFPEDSAVYAFGQILENSVLHKFIVQEQKRRGFDVAGMVEKLIIGYDNWAREEFLDKKSIMRLISLQVDSMVQSCLGEDMARALENFPRANGYAKRIFSKMNAVDYRTPLETRRAIVRAYREFDIICSEIGLPKLDLNNNITIDFVASKRQLDLTIGQLFSPIYFGDYGKMSLISKADGQNSFIIDVEQKDMDKYCNMTLRDMYKQLGTVCLCRECTAIAPWDM